VSTVPPVSADRNRCCSELEFEDLNAALECKDRTRKSGAGESLAPFSSVEMARGATTAGTPAAPVRKGNRMPDINILIADDTTLIRHLLSFQLGQINDFNVVGEAEDGRQAVEMALKLRPDVIVMDLDMPYLNGIQAVERIVGQYPHVSIVLLTAHRGLAPIGRFSGVSECLDKNCTPADLVQAIRRARNARLAKTPSQASGSSHHAAIALLATRSGLTDRERAVFEKALDTELTIEQIATVLSAQTKEKVTLSSVKHALDRAITKLRIEPRTRAALVKHVLEFNPQVFSGQGED
jgi:DNA-binding NarL/FixJ family response regulator